MPVAAASRAFWDARFGGTGRFVERAQTVDPLRSR
jgi:hypothetical protein